MANETEKTEGFQDPAENNAAVKAKLESQDISGHNMAPEDTQEAGVALDALVKAAEADAKAKAEASAEPKPDDNAAPAPPEKTEEQLAAEKAAAEAEEAQKKRADELFKDSPALPPNASVKSNEAFSQIKIRAAKEIAAREAELEKLRKEHSEMQEKLKNPVPDDVRKELEDHRTWRARLDVEADPKFKVFDKTVQETQDFIYSQLKRSPVITDDIIAEIKKHGGPDKVQMDKIFEAIKDPAMQRLIEAKLADIEMAKYNKTKIIEETKKNIDQYRQDREKAATESLRVHNVETEKHLSGLTSRLDWFKEKPVDEKLPEADRKNLEEHNKFVKGIQGQLKEALNDDSPEMRAIMLTGMAQLFYLQNVHSGALAKLQAVEKNLAEVTEKYDKLRKGSVVKPSGAPPAGSVKVQEKPVDIFNTSASESLDAIARQISEERQRAK